MTSLQSWLGEAKDMAKKKVYVEPSGEKPDIENSADPKSEMKYSANMFMKKKKGKMATCSGY